MILYDYCRSSAAYRVRIALNLKGFDYQQVSINLLSAEQRSKAHSARNTQQLVPVLEDRQNYISQSLAICEYLDDAYPETDTLVSGTPIEKAKIRAFAQMIACETHPLNNLRVLKHLQQDFGLDDEAKMRWYHHWIHVSFSALEAKLEQRNNTTLFCYSNTPSLADVFLIPQMFNAHRFEVDLSAYPLLCAIEARCNALPAFTAAHPSNQPDS